MSARRWDLENLNRAVSAKRLAFADVIDRKQKRSSIMCGPANTMARWSSKCTKDRGLDNMRGIVRYSASKVVNGRLPDT